MNPTFPLLLLFTSLASASAFGGFMQTCQVNVGRPVVPRVEEVSKGYWWLITRCKQTNGEYTDELTTLRLDKCFGNDNGRLVAQKDGYATKSCTILPMRPASEGGRLFARCRTPGGEERDTSLDMNESVTNHNGKLAC